MKGIYQVAVLLCMFFVSGMASTANGDTKSNEPNQNNRSWLRPFNIKSINFSSGFEYSKNDRIENLRLVRFRDVTIPVGLNLSFSKSGEFYVSVPVLYSHREFTAFNESIKTDDDGFGDLTVGLSIKLRSETAGFPGVNGSLSVSVPTGSTEDAEDLDSIEFTSGFLKTTAGISVTKSVDPAQLFGNIGYSFTRKESQFGEIVEPGASFNYGFGVAFSINSKVSLNGRYSGSYVKDTRRDNVRLSGSGNEALDLSFGVSYQVSKKLSTDTSVAFGINGDANDATINFGFSYALISFR